MAVRTQNTEVLEAVVVRSAIDVIELERDWAPVPLGAVAHLAGSLLQAHTNEAPLQVVRLHLRPEDQDFLE